MKTKVQYRSARRTKLPSPMHGRSYWTIGGWRARSSLIGGQIIPWPFLLAKTVVGLDRMAGEGLCYVSSMRPRVLIRGTMMRFIKLDGRIGVGRHFFDRRFVASTSLS